MRFSRIWLAYLFESFTVGVACLGVAVSLTLRRRDALSRTFLAAYAVLSVMVTASLVLASAATAPDVISPAARQVFQYLESIVGFYGVMLTLPFFVHGVFGVENPLGERGGVDQDARRTRGELRELSPVKRLGYVLLLRCVRCSGSGAFGLETEPVELQA